MPQLNPQITIIVPLLNKVNEVCRAIDSIFAQTIQDFELLVVDGGSTDGSLDAIKKYEADSRFHIIHQKSKGLPAGRNEGIAAAAADIVAFLDADDEWLPDFLEKILQLRDKFPNAGLYATAFVTRYKNSTDNPRLVDVPDAPWEGILPSYFRTSALAFIYPFMPSCAAIPKSTFKKTGLFNPALRTGEDSEMWGRIALELPIAFNSSPKMRYYAVADNKMTNNPRVMKEHPFITYLNSYPHDKLQSHPDYANILLYLQKEEIGIALNNFYAGAPDAARENLKRVHEKQFMKYKSVLTALSYLPAPLLKKILPVANSLGRK